MKLYEVANPWEPLVRVATRFRDAFEDIGRRLLPCVAKAIRGAELAGDRVIVPIPSRFAGGRAPSNETAGLGQMASVLKAWGARDIDFARNTLTWWDGRSMRIGRALVLLSELAARPDWRDREFERRSKWIEERERRGQSLPVPREVLLRLPDRLPPTETFREWQIALARSVRPGARGARRGDELVAVLTVDPVENAHRSTRRGWTSCYDPEQHYDPERAWSRIVCALAQGAVVLWLTNRGDATRLASPTGRSAINVLVNRMDPKSLRLRPEPDGPYGEVPEWWQQFVSWFTDRVNARCGKEVGPYAPIWWAPDSVTIVDPRKGEERTVAVGTGGLPSAIYVRPPKTADELATVLQRKFPDTDVRMSEREQYIWQEFFHDEHVKRFVPELVRRALAWDDSLDTALRAAAKAAPQSMLGVLVGVWLVPQETARQLRKDEFATELLDAARVVDPDKISGGYPVPALRRVFRIWPDLPVWHLYGGAVLSTPEDKAFFLAAIDWGENVAWSVVEEILEDPRVAREFVALTEKRMRRGKKADTEDLKRTEFIVRFLPPAERARLVDVVLRNLDREVLEQALRPGSAARWALAEILEMVRDHPGSVAAAWLDVLGSDTVAEAVAKSRQYREELGLVVPAGYLGASATDIEALAKRRIDIASLGDEEYETWVRALVVSREPGAVDALRSLLEARLRGRTRILDSLLREVPESVAEIVSKTRDVALLRDVLLALMHRSEYWRKYPTLGILHDVVERLVELDRADDVMQFLLEQHPHVMVLLFQILGHVGAELVGEWVKRAPVEKIKKFLRSLVRHSGYLVAGRSVFWLLLEAAVRNGSPELADRLLQPGGVVSTALATGAVDVSGLVEVFGCARIFGAAEEDELVAKELARYVAGERAREECLRMTADAIVNDSPFVRFITSQRLLSVVVPRLVARGFLDPCVVVERPHADDDQLARAVAGMVAVLGEQGDHRALHRISECIGWILSSPKMPERIKFLEQLLYLVSRLPRADQFLRELGSRITDAERVMMRRDPEAAARFSAYIGRVAVPPAEPDEAYLRYITEYVRRNPGRAWEILSFLRFVRWGSILMAAILEGLEEIPEPLLAEMIEMAAGSPARLAVLLRDAGKRNFLARVLGMILTLKGRDGYDDLRAVIEAVERSGVPMESLRKALGEAIRGLEGRALGSAAALWVELFGSLPDDVEGIARRTSRSGFRSFLSTVHRVLGPETAHGLEERLSELRHPATG